MREYLYPNARKIRSGVWRNADDSDRTTMVCVSGKTFPWPIYFEIRNGLNVLFEVLESLYIYEADWLIK